MKRKIAQISGATLGYITNNVQGAYTGYQLAGKAYDYMHRKRGKTSSNNRNMAPVPAVVVNSTPARGRTKQRAPYNTPKSLKKKSSRMSMSSGRSRSRIRFSMHSSSNNVVASASRKRGRKVKREGRKKPVRVGKLFRKKVNAVFTKRGPNGHFQEIVMNPIMKPIDNRQDLQFTSIRPFDGIVGWNFTPTYIAYVYALLYNKASYPATVTTDITYNGVTGAGVTPNLQIHVKEQYYIVRMKNNTARTMTVKLWDISPKNVQEEDFTNTLDFLFQELVGKQPFGAAGTAGQQSRENPLSINYQTIGFNPKMLSSFRHHFTLDETIITLEAGKEYVHKVKGPNDKMYKFNSFFKADTYRPVQKFCKQTLVAHYLDMVGNEVAPGRVTDIVNEDGYGLLTEQTCYTTIKCPDQTGFQNPATVTVGAIQPLTQKGYCFGIKNWGDVTQIGPVFDIEDETGAPATAGK